MANLPDPEDSVDLVRRVASGDDASLGALLERYLPRLRAFVRLRVDAGMRQLESCSDLVRSVCRQVLEGASGFEWRSEEAFRGWLFKTALNKLRERARLHRAERRHPKHEHAADSNGDDHLLPMYLVWGFSRCRSDCRPRCAGARSMPPSSSPCRRVARRNPFSLAVDR